MIGLIGYFLGTIQFLVMFEKKNKIRRTKMKTTTFLTLKKNPSNYKKVCKSKLHNTIFFCYLL